MFDRWYGLFVDAVDGGWRGPRAEQAKGHAARIAGMLSRMIASAEWSPPVASGQGDE
jgi:hypothetical protein